jgi:iron(III) transport system substrate-binding protein
LKPLSLKPTLAVLTIALSTLVVAGAAVAQTSVQTMLAYKGADRQQKLVAAAQKEGTLTLYTSISNAVGLKLISDFEAKYGVKVKMYRAGDGVVLQKMLAERSAKRPVADILNIGSVEMEMAHREKLLAPMKTALHDGLIKGAVGSDNEYVATFVNPMVQAYNTNAVKKEDLPKTYQDLLDPKWKGRLALEATDEEWFYDLVTHMGEEKGLKYFRDLMATNKPSVRTGHSLLGNLVASGEVPLGLTVYAHTVLAAKKIGAPIDYTLLEPVIAVSFSMGLARLAPHPNAALLFYEYLLTDGQKVFAESDYTPTLKSLDTTFANVPYLISSQPKFLDKYEKWEKLYSEIVKQK